MVPRKVAVIGAGWAGLAAALRAVSDGHQVTVFEATRNAGGRARTVKGTSPVSSTSPSSVSPSASSSPLGCSSPSSPAPSHATASPPLLDNGQHILIGAYTETLRLMRMVGVNPEQVLHRQALALCFPDGAGLKLPNWSERWGQWEVLAGIARAKGWSWSDKWRLLRTAMAWQRAGFRCDPQTTVAKLCETLSTTVYQGFIEPLCVSALNTPADQASGQVFLRVLQDALFGVPGGSKLLLPTQDLGQLFPVPAVQWLLQRGCTFRWGVRVSRLQVNAGWARSGAPAMGLEENTQDWHLDGHLDWHVENEVFHQVILATPPAEAARLLRQCVTEAPSHTVASSSPPPFVPTSPPCAPPALLTTLHPVLTAWADTACALRFEAIATVYARHATAPIPVDHTTDHSADHTSKRTTDRTVPRWQAAQAMTALAATAVHPAQFVFDRGLLGDASGLLAFVVSASQGDKGTLEQQVTDQAQQQLGWTIVPVQTIVEKRATFACTPGLLRPSQHIAPGLCACGDYVEGPYPATLEGAVRSGWAAGEIHR